MDESGKKQQEDLVVYYAEARRSEQTCLAPWYRMKPSLLWDKKGVRFPHRPVVLEMPEDLGLDTGFGPGISFSSCSGVPKNPSLSLPPSLCSWRAGCWPSRPTPPAQPLPTLNENKNGFHTSTLHACHQICTAPYPRQCHAHFTDVDA